MLPLTGGSGDRSTRDSSGELSNQANGGAVLPNGRVYGRDAASQWEANLKEVNLEYLFYLFMKIVSVCLHN